MNERRIKILLLTARGKAPKEVAAEMSISLVAVYENRKAIIRLLGARTIENAILIGVKRGYISIEA